MDCMRSREANRQSTERLACGYKKLVQTLLAPVKVIVVRLPRTEVHLLMIEIR